MNPTNLLKISSLQTKNTMVGWQDGNSGWFFANEFYQPSYWLMLKREGFSGDLVRSSTEADYLLYKLSRSQLADIYLLHHPHNHQPSQHHTEWSLRHQVKQLILSGRIHVFKIENHHNAFNNDAYHRLTNPDDHIAAENAFSPQPGHSHSASNIRVQLAEELGRDITARWVGKDHEDKLHWNRWWLWRELIEVSDVGAELVDTVVNTVQGLWELGVVVVTLVEGAIDLQIKLHTQTLNLMNNAATGDIEAIKHDLAQLGIAIDNRIDSVKKLINQTEAGYDVFRQLNNDPQTSTLLADYFDSLIQCVKYRKSRTFGARIVFEVGLEVLIALATAGTATVARRAASMSRLASGSQRIGPLTRDAINLLVKLAKAIKKQNITIHQQLEVSGKLPATLPSVKALDIPKHARMDHVTERDVGLNRDNDVVPNKIGSPSELAKSFQGSDPYFGVDSFRDITLKKGTFITSGVHSPDLDDLSGFFTTQSGLNRTLTDGVVDANKFNQGLQIFSARPQYRPGVTVFEVLEDTPAAFGLTKANPKFNPGGYKSLPQIYIPEFESILKPVKSIPAINKKAPKYD